MSEVKTSSTPELTPQQLVELIDRSLGLWSGQWFGRSFYSQEHFETAKSRLNQLLANRASGGNMDDSEKRIVRVLEQLKQANKDISAGYGLAFFAMKELPHINAELEEALEDRPPDEEPKS